MRAGTRAGGNAARKRALFAHAPVTSYDLLDDEGDDDEEMGGGETAARHTAHGTRHGVSQREAQGKEGRPWECLTERRRW